MSQCPVIVGAYAAAPLEHRERQTFTRAVTQLYGVKGLEIPFGSSAYRGDSEWLFDSLEPGRNHVFTLVAAQMENMARDSHFGLASTDEGGREAALSLVQECREAIETAQKQGNQIVAVQIQSGPRLGNVDCFIQSLREISRWDWGTTSVVIEHCDAAGGVFPPAKGFLSLDEELHAVQSVQDATHVSLGISINWGRSAIEARSADGPLQHIEKVRNAGCLRGLMFSGACAQTGAYGAAWSDSHAALFSTDAKAGCLESLLTDTEISRCLAAARVEDLDFVGAKFAAQSGIHGAADRVLMIARGLRSIVDNY